MKNQQIKNQKISDKIGNLILRFNGDRFIKYESLDPIVNGLALEQCQKYGKISSIEVNANGNLEVRILK